MTAACTPERPDHACWTRIRLGDQTIRPQPHDACRHRGADAAAAGVRRAVPVGVLGSVRPGQQDAGGPGERRPRRRRRGRPCQRGRRDRQEPDGRSQPGLARGERQGGARRRRARQVLLHAGAPGELQRGHRLTCQRQSPEGPADRGVQRRQQLHLLDHRPHGHQPGAQRGVDPHLRPGGQSDSVRGGFVRHRHQTGGRRGAETGRRCRAGRYRRGQIGRRPRRRPQRLGQAVRGSQTTLFRHHPGHRPSVEGDQGPVTGRREHRTVAAERDGARAGRRSGRRPGHGTGHRGGGDRFGDPTTFGEPGPGFGRRGQHAARRPGPTERPSVHATDPSADHRRPQCRDLDDRDTALPRQPAANGVGSGGQQRSAAHRQAEPVAQRRSATGQRKRAIGPASAAPSTSAPAWRRRRAWWPIRGCRP